MKIIKLPCFCIEVTQHPSGAYSIISALHEEDSDDSGEFNARMDGIESLILAHAQAGIDIANPAYVEGIEVSVEACSQN